MSFGFNQIKKEWYEILRVDNKLSNIYVLS